MTDPTDQLDVLARNWISEFEPAVSQMTDFQWMAASALGGSSLLRQSKLPIPWDSHTKFTDYLRASGRFDFVVYMGPGGASVRSDDLPFRLAAAASDPQRAIQEELLTQAIAQLREYLTAEEVTITVSSELYGLTTDAPFSINDHVSLVPNTLKPSRITWALLIPQPAYSLQARAKVRLGFGAPPATANQDGKIVDALYRDLTRTAQVLMVSHPGPFTPGPMTVACENWVPPVGFQTGPVRPTFPTNLDQLDVPATEVGALRRRAAAAQSLESSGNRHLLVALQRFFLGKMRGTREDRLIDLMVAAEALFLNDSRQELSFRLATRAAMFLADEKPARIAVFKAMRTAYDVRSALVHGAQADPGQVLASANEAERLMRSAIQRALDMVASNQSQAIGKWDDLAFLEL